MGRGHGFWDHLAEDAELMSGILPGQCLVEIAGESRVLIENHSGVAAYSRERIVIKVKFGTVSVCGCGLEMIRLTPEQLVIRGRIDAVSLHRGG